MTLEQKHKLVMFPKIGKLSILIFSIALVISGIWAWVLYGYIFRPNVKTEYILTIRKNASFDQVCDSLVKNDVLHDMKAFKWVSKKKKYNKMLKPGRYHFKKEMNSNQIVNMLRGGLQEPVSVIFNNIRTKEQLAGIIGRYLEADSLSVLELFTPEKAAEYGFTTETFAAMFIPNTYEFYWTSTATDFANRMKAEYTRFWNEERLKKAKALGMTPIEVATLAAIVQEETNKNDEKPLVAGVYINRLKKGMALQADPTVKFAVGDVTLRRVLLRHLDFESPYNTYLHPGLPPGPITFPEISSLNAVLNYKNHNYIYFCAREDLSGYHNFARTLSEHNSNADRYRAALDSMRIYR